MKFNIITIFPAIFDSYFNESILKRAQKKGLVDFNVINLRDFAADKHKTVDDTPYGGGAGMVMKIEPIFKAIMALKTQNTNYKAQTKHNPPAGVAGTQITKPKQNKIILLSAKGKKWNQQIAKKYSKLDEVILICGRYEGVDERVKKLVDEEISIGDYVMTGGELGAMVIVDSITRLLPGVLGNAESAVSESHSLPGVLEYPHYTRPEIFKVKSQKLKVPKVLLSGNHAEIEKWRKKHSKIRKK